MEVKARVETAMIAVNFIFVCLCESITGLTGSFVFLLRRLGLLILWLCGKTL